MIMEGKELKQAFVERLRDRIGKQPYILQTLANIDQRIADYIMHVVRNCEGDKDVHNIDEVAACCKMMRMAAAYDINHTEVRKFIRMYEQFYFSGINGRQRYRMRMRMRCKSSTRSRCQNAASHWPARSKPVKQ